MSSSITRSGVLGKGAYGIVYSAEIDDPTGASSSALQARRGVALKRLIKETDNAFTSGLSEIDMLAECRGHPFIVNTLKVVDDLGEGDEIEEPDGEDEEWVTTHEHPLTPLGDHGFDQSFVDNKYHLVFERADCDLFHLIVHRGKTLDTPTRIRMIYQLLLALEWLHVRDILHRDVKATNCLVFNGPDGWTLKLADFGLAKRNHPILPSTPSTYTFEDRAPEVALGCESYDGRADVWAAGCVAFFILTGRCLIHPTGDSTAEVVNEILAVHEQTFLDIDEFLGMYDHADPDVERILKKLPYGKAVTRGPLSGALRPRRVDVEVALKSYGVDEAWCEPCAGLIRAMLQLDPEDRPRAKEVLDTFADLFHKAGGRPEDRQRSISFSPLRELEPWEPHPIPAEAAQDHAAALALARGLFVSGNPDILRDARTLVHAMDAFERYLIWREAQTNPRLLAVLTTDPEVVFIGMVHYFVKFFSVMSYIPFEKFLKRIAGVKIDKDDEVLEKTFPDVVRRVHATLEAQPFAFEYIEMLLMNELFRFRSFQPTVFQAIQDAVGEDFVDAEYPARITELCLTAWNELTSNEAVVERLELLERSS